MRAKFGSVEVEGTPEELAAFIKAANPFALSETAASSTAEKSSGRQFVTENVAFMAVKRRPLSREQAIVLKALRDKSPEWTLAATLSRATGYNPNQLGGLFGAFGKRLAATDGYVAGTWFFDQEWNYEKDCYAYRLPPPVLAAVKRALP